VSPPPAVACFWDGRNAVANDCTVKVPRDGSHMRLRHPSNHSTTESNSVRNILRLSGVIFTSKVP
jgi:hypothetical protein